jgi:tripartite-type tricarboxylate transporter receptor subunit TctC
VTSVSSRRGHPAPVLVALGLVICCALAHPAPSSAQDYPNKPIKLIVPYPAGGSADILARIVGHKLAEQLGQAMVVENRAGAGTAIGTEFVARSRPDGYTLLLGTVSSHAMNPALNPGLGYDAIKDFAPVAPLATIPFVLDVNAKLPVRTVKELVAYAKAHPGSVNYSSAGNGTSNHLAGELFNIMGGVDLVHVPYKGSAPALQDLVAGQVQLMFDLVSTSIPWIRSGAIRPLAVTGATRIASLPDVPTMKESGYPDYEVTAWFGIFAPAGTPEAVVARLNAEAAKAIASAEVKDKLGPLGMETLSATPQGFARLVAADLGKWRDVVKSAKIRAD